MATEVKKKTKGFFGEFREFISKGSVMDMAVGIIIGGAFQAIINSLVNDILMPLTSTPARYFANWASVACQTFAESVCGLRRRIAENGTPPSAPAEIAQMATDTTEIICLMITLSTNGPRRFLF